MVGRTINVICIVYVRCPGCALIGVVVDNCFQSKWCNWIPVAIKEPLYFLVGRDGIGELQRAQYIQRVLDLWDDLVPQLEWVSCVDHGEHGNCVVFSCLDCRLGIVEAMIVRLDKLDVGFIFFSK